MHAALMEVIVGRGWLPTTVRASITVSLYISGRACVAALLRSMEGRRLLTGAQLHTCFVILSELRLIKLAFSSTLDSDL